MYLLPFSLGLLGFLLDSPLVVGQAQPQGPCVFNDCRELVDASSCYNGAISAGSKERLFGCVAGGEAYVCNCYGCDTNLLQFTINNKVCPNATATPVVDPPVPTWGR